MSVRKTLAAVIVLGLAVTGCDYVVPPISFDTPTPAIASKGWAAIVTNVAEVNGGLHVELSLRNDNNDWSAMDVGSSKAKVTDSAGKTTDCTKVFVGTSVFVNDGGWFLPPGFIMKGYTGGTLASPATQLISVDCAGVAKAAGEKLAIDYMYIIGPWNYYRASTKNNATFNLNLDTVVTDVKYPVAAKVASLTIEKSDAVIVGINNCTVQLDDVQRSDTAFTFSWESKNPTEYNAFVHIGNPPVIGADGIMYGFYEAPHLALAPITPAAATAPASPGPGDATWTTTVSVPKEATAFYVLLPLESLQEKKFVDHVIDITAKSAINSTGSTPSGSSSSAPASPGDTSSPGAPSVSSAPSA
jgi:hypothetical protein